MYQSKSRSGPWISMTHGLKYASFSTHHISNYKTFSQSGQKLTQNRGTSLS